MVFCYRSPNRLRQLLYMKENLTRGNLDGCSANMVIYFLLPVMGTFCTCLLDNDQLKKAEKNPPPT